MLGQFMGTFVGTKALGTVTKAGKAAMLSKVQGARLGMDVGHGLAETGAKIAKAPVGKLAAKAKFAFEQGAGIRVQTLEVAKKAKNAGKIYASRDLDKH